MKQLLIALTLFIFSGVTQAKDFVSLNDFIAGQHYVEVKTDVVAPNQVMEFFSYYCPHCYNFEPIVKELKVTLPAKVSFIKTPVSYMGREMGPELQRAHAAAILLQQQEAITPALFSAIHQKRSAPRDRAAVKQLFVDAGVAGEKFDNVIDSPEVQQQVANYNTLINSFQIRSVPTFVVNGRYLININQVRSQADFNALVNYLLTLPANGADDVTAKN